jgi:hypothetical protein
MDKFVTIAVDVIGQPARPVVRLLRRAGLVPRVEWSHVGDIPVGTVIAVRPRGNVESGTIVTLTVAALQSDLRGG